MERQSDQIEASEAKRLELVRKLAASPLLFLHLLRLLGAVKIRAGVEHLDGLLLRQRRCLWCCPGFHTQKTLSAFRVSESKFRLFEFQDLECKSSEISSSQGRSTILLTEVHR